MTSAGLRELKKRETRKRISDVATDLFIARGFETVTIAEVAAAAQVSEKTVYNYFATKESLVLDEVDEQLTRLVGATRDRPTGTTPTAAIICALRPEIEFFSTQPPGGTGRILQFAAMLHATPALRAAVGEHRHQIVLSLSEVLAKELDVHPLDPEVRIAAQALTSLVELVYDSVLRHVQDGVFGNQLSAMVTLDVERGARLLDTGLRSLPLLAPGQRINA
ncbi:MAG: TetR/AcrR family transcriptional regulator [Solirubrobacteraceae bacterium]